MSDTSSAYDAGYHAGVQRQPEDCYADPAKEDAYELGYMTGEAGLPEQNPANSYGVQTAPAYDPNYQPQDTMGPANPGQYPRPGEGGEGGDDPHGEYGDPDGKTPGHWDEDGHWIPVWVPDVEVDAVD